MRNYILHLENPAVDWENASPIGAGSLGKMVFGTVSSEKLVLNEESIWAGGPKEKKIDGFLEKIKYARQLFLDGNPGEADKWMTDNMEELFAKFDSYEYAGELHVKLHEDDICENYRRDIDLMHGICTVSYTKDGADYKREYFASYPAKMICGRYTSTKEFDADITYKRENITSLSVLNDYIVAVGKTNVGDNAFSVYVKIKTDGKTEALDAGISVTQATFIETYTGIFTQFKFDDMKSAAMDVMIGANRDMSDIRREHEDDFYALMARSDISFEFDESVEKLPVDERIERLKADKNVHDFGLMSLYWQFGKYLLISSSREGTLPANLQGVWSEGLVSPWMADYHVNINLQMNYWQAEQANIPECTYALFGYMNNYLLENGRQEAKLNYGTGGMVVHHVSDIYGYTAINSSIRWGMWPMGGAWLAYHMWEHYLYTQDKEFLRNTAYTYIRECAVFFAENLAEGKDGYLHSGPSMSPENYYYTEVDGEKYQTHVALSPTMDIEIIGGLFDFYAETEDILGIDPEFADKIRKMRSKLPPLKIGSKGQLLEWLEEYEEVEPGHRHISHAFGLYPSSEITRKTPDLLAGIEKTLDMRLSCGGGHTGWSRAWIINLFARLRNKEKTYENIRALFTKSTLPNLLDTHPPFQIDGNFGGSAGIGEMIMQSHEGCISIIPSVPEYLNGSFTGLRARGGITVSAEWRDGLVKSVTLTPDNPCSVVLELPGRDPITLKLDKTTTITE